MKSLREKDLNPLEWKCVLHQQHDGEGGVALIVLIAIVLILPIIFLYPSNCPRDLESSWEL